jgi:transposase
VSYSVEYRKNVLDFCERDGNTIRKASEVFNLSPTTICNWKNLRKRQGNLQKKKPVRKFQKINIKELERMIKICPDMLQREMAEQFGVVRSSIQDALKKLGIKRKKNSFVQRKEREKKEGILGKNC